MYAVRLHSQNDQIYCANGVKTLSSLAFTIGMFWKPPGLNREGNFSIYCKWELFIGQLIVNISAIHSWSSVFSITKMGMT